MELKYLHLYLHILTIIVCSVIAFIHLIKVKSSPLNIFSIYAFAGLYISLINTLKMNNHISHELALASNSIGLIFHYLFLGLYLISQFEKKPNITNGFTIVFLAGIPLLIKILPVKAYGTFPNPGIFATANSILVILCLKFFIDLFQSAPNRILMKDPSFWIVIGIFICLSITIPIFLLHKLLIDNLSPSVFQIINAIIGIAYSLMHLFFIKGFLCSLQMKQAH